MNMILHGIEVSNIVHTNTLADLADIHEKDRFDAVLAFGGKSARKCARPTAQ